MLISRVQRVSSRLTEFPLSAVTAVLPVLPEPLRLRHGPLLVTVETWSDGAVTARLPVVGLWASAESDTLALDALGTEIAMFVEDVEPMAKMGGIGGALKRQWEAICALVEMP